LSSIKLTDQAVLAVFLHNICISPCVAREENVHVEPVSGIRGQGFNQLPTACSIPVHTLRDGSCVRPFATGADISK